MLNMNLKNLMYFFTFVAIVFDVLIRLITFGKFIIYENFPVWSNYISVPGVMQTVSHIIGPDNWGIFSFMYSFISYILFLPVLIYNFISFIVLFIEAFFSSLAQPFYIVFPADIATGLISISVLFVVISIIFSLRILGSGFND